MSNANVARPAAAAAANPAGRWITVNDKVRRRTVLAGDKMMQMFVEFYAGGHTPEHAHVHDQVVHVLRGRMRFTLAGSPHEVAQGQSIYFPSNVPHAADAIEDSLLLDTFTPVRTDLLQQDAGEEVASGQ
ncbi:MAG TPA: cupin domain-containing protein [Tepidisphaeraceae bacterium]|nr:cupin domain-containing protein [Tepidisphaeraceae bacterium]